MSEKRYVLKCEECGKKYVAKSKKSRFDTVSCRSRYHRKKQDSLISNQAKVIQRQSSIIKEIIPVHDSKRPYIKAEVIVDWDKINKELAEWERLSKLRKK